MPAVQRWVEREQLHRGLRCGALQAATTIPAWQVEGVAALLHATTNCTRHPPDFLDLCVYGHNPMLQCWPIANCVGYSQEDCSCSTCQDRFTRAEDGSSCAVRRGCSLHDLVVVHSCPCTFYFDAVTIWHELLCAHSSTRSALLTAPTARPWPRMVAAASSAKQDGTRTTPLGGVTRCVAGRTGWKLQQS